MKMKSNRFGVFLFLTFLLLSFAEAEIQELELGVQYEKSFDADNNLTNTFSVKIKTLIKDTDLFVTAKGKDQRSDPDIYISKDPLKANPKGEADYNCQSFGLDVCTVPSDRVSENTTYYIGIYCSVYPCNVSFVVYYQEEYIMDLNHQIYIKYSQVQDSQVEFIKLKVPKKDSSSTRPYKAIIIQAEVWNTNEIEDSIELYVNKGNEAPSSQYSIAKGDYIWAGGKGVKLDGRLLCDDCNYTIGVEAGRNAIVVFTAFTVGNERNVTLFQPYGDIIGAENERESWFVLDLQTNPVRDNEILFVDVLPIYGDPDLFISCGDTRPEKVAPGQYRWKSDFVSQEQIQIQASDLKEFCSSSSRKLWITVYSAYVSTYQLLAYVEQRDNLILQFETQTTAQLHHEQVLNYRLMIQKTGEKSNVSLDLENYSRFMDLHFFVKGCRAKEDCRFSVSEVQQYVRDPAALPSGYHRAKLEQQHSRLTFEHDELFCAQNNQLQCVYVLGVFATLREGQEEEATFSVLAHLPQEFVQLRDTEVFHGEVGALHYRKFYFNLPDAATVHELRFQLTRISGDAQLLYSPRRLDPELEELKDARFAEFGQLIVSGAELASRMHYLYVKGLSASAFTLTTQIVHEEAGHRVSYVSLERDLYLDFYLKAGEQLLFEIDLEQRENLTVRLTPLQGRFDIFLGVDKYVPAVSEETSYWSSLRGVGPQNQHRRHRNGLWVLEKDDRYPHDRLAFYGSVQLRNDTEFTPAEGVLYHFQITYHTDSSMHLLQEGVPYSGGVQAQEEQGFKFQVLKDVAYTLTLNTPTEQKNLLEVFVSASQRRTFANQQWNDGAFHFEKEVFEFDWKLLEKRSGQNNWFNAHRCSFTGGQPCYIYFVLRANVTTQVTLLVNRASSGTATPAELLLDGVEVTSFLSQSLRQRYFRFKLPYKKESKVVLSSEYGRLRIIARVLDQDRVQNLTEVLSPQTAQLENRAGVAQLDQFLLVSHETVEKFCNSAQKEFCTLVLAVMFDNEEEVLDQQQRWTFTVKALAFEVQELSEGVPTYGFVEQFAWAYYLVHVGDKSRDLLITLQGLAGSDPELYVSAGANDFPTQEHADYASIGFSTDYIEIGKALLVPGTYKVGVYGQTKSTFLLQYSLANFRQYKVQFNQPLGFEAEAGQRVYFKYFHYLEKDFQVVLSLTYGGEVVLGLQRFDDQTGTIDFQRPCTEMDLHTKTTSNLGSFYDLEVSSAQNPKLYCKDCNYLIAVCSDVALSGTLLVEIEDEVTFLQFNSPVKNQVALSHEQRYGVIYLDAFQLKVTLYTGALRLRLYSQTADSTEGELHSEVEIRQQGQTAIPVSLRARQEGSGAFSLGEFLGVRVEGLALRSFFQLEVTDLEENGSELHVNQPAVVSLRPGVWYEFDFYFNKKAQNEQQFFVVFQAKSGEVFSGDAGRLLTSQLVLLDMVSQKELPFTGYEDFSASEQQIFYSVREPPTSLYRLKLFNSHDFTIEGTVLYQLQSPALTLLPGYSIFNYQYSLEDEDIYRLFIEPQQKVLVQIDQCLGKFDLDVSFFPGFKQNGDLSGQTTQFNPMFDLTRVIELGNKLVSDQLYLRVRTLLLHQGRPESHFNELQKQNLSAYQIRIKSFRPDQIIPFQNFILPEDGILRPDWDGNVLRVKYWQIKCLKQDCLDFMLQGSLSMKPLQTRVVTFTYKIVLGQDDSLVHARTHCNYEAGHELYQVYSDAQYTQENITSFFRYHQVGSFEIREQDLPQELKSGIVQVSLVAQLSYTDEMGDEQTYKFYYNPIQVNLSLKLGGSSTSVGWIIVLVIILLALTVVLYFVYKRYRMIQQTLKYEMNDVRNVAGISRTELQPQTQSEIIQFQEFKDEQ